MKLTTRVSAFFLSALAVILIGNSMLLYGVARSYLQHHFDEQLDSLLHILVAAAEVEIDDVKFESTDHFVIQDAYGDPGDLFWLVLSEEGQVVAHSENYHSASGIAPGNNNALLLNEQKSLNRPGWRVVRHHLAAPDPKPRSERSPLEHAELTVVAARKLEPLQRTLFWLAVALIVLPLICWLIAALLGRRFCERALKPIRQMADEVRAIDVQDTRARLDVQPTRDELEELGVTFNELLDQLFQEYEHQRRFAGNTAHQLRTPLTVMQGQVDVALRRPRSVEEYQETLTTVSQATTSLSQTVEALLFLARPAGDEPIPDYQLTELSSWLQQYLEHWKSTPRWDDIRVEADAGLRCKTSPTLLAQVLDILVTNALKYSEPGTPVGIQVRHKEASILMEVSDQGMGILAEDREAIFEPFFRTRQARQQASPGTGLGLALARHIATALDGTLVCIKDSDSGAQFRLTLPAEV
ncbi:ATP-binding protein [Gimesia sp.]|uniref:ATP-binding protein n=1 Tax=Gimesia sp. TaxID=2024833 RepID=UPI003A9428E8